MTGDLMHSYQIKKAKAQDILIIGTLINDYLDFHLFFIQFIYCIEPFSRTRTTNEMNPKQNL